MSFQADFVGDLGLHATQYGHRVLTIVLRAEREMHKPSNYGKRSTLLGDARFYDEV